MRILAITGQLAFPSENIRFQQTWYYLLHCEQIKRSNMVNLIADRHLKFEYLPERIRTQFLLFEPQVIILHVSYRNEEFKQLGTVLTQFRSQLPTGIQIILLPVPEMNVNVSFLKHQFLFPSQSEEKFETLCRSLNCRYTEEDHQKLFQYILECLG